MNMNVDRPGRWLLFVLCLLAVSARGDQDATPGGEMPQGSSEERSAAWDRVRDSALKGDLAAQARLRAALDGPDDWGREKASWYLSRHENTPETARRIAGRIPHEQRHLQYELAKDLAWMSSNAIPPLLDLLQSTNAGAREAGAEALGYIADPNQVGGEATDRIADPRVIDALIRLQEDEEGNVSAKASEALRAIGGAKAVRAVRAKQRQAWWANYFRREVDEDLPLAVAVLGFFWARYRVRHRFKSVPGLGRRFLSFGLSLAAAFMLFVVGALLLQFARDDWKMDTAARLVLFALIPGPVFWMVLYGAGAAVYPAFRPTAQPLASQETRDADVRPPEPEADLEIPAGPGRLPRLLYGLVLPLVASPIPVMFLFMLGDSPRWNGGGGDPLRGAFALIGCGMATFGVLCAGAVVNAVVALVTHPESRKQAFWNGMWVTLGIGLLVRLFVFPAWSM